MIFEVQVGFADEIHKFKLYKEYFSISNIKLVYFKEISSLHTKDNNLLRIKLVNNENIIINFPKVNLRDAVKTILLVLGKESASAKKRMTELYKTDFIKTTNIKRNDNISMDNFIPGNYTFDNDDTITSFYSFVLMMINSSTLCKIFLDMECSINHFYKLYVESYYFDINNKQNILDTKINDNYEQKLNFANRINLYSNLNVNESIEDIKVNEESLKEIDFTIVNDMHLGKITTKNVVLEDFDVKGYLNSFKLHKTDLNRLKLDNNIIENVKEIKVDQEDFETAREFCKLVYINPENKELIQEAKEFSENFRKVMCEKYGNDILKVIERNIPDFYIKE
ncbi:hypothetical protein HERIO_176 [Hepatospora eriocheir]|uniref:Uncharacterized protein n=1 Tax=Hepatospora eriocheir TaxID=1081669 RepID=A0A1X0QE00_9MICR|nr:hypothetical protein HERIO_176 [Hepatospora eriocheir]